MYSRADAERGAKGVFHGGRYTGTPFCFWVYLSEREISGGLVPADTFLPFILLSRQQVASQATAGRLSAFANCILLLCLLGVCAVLDAHSLAPGAAKVA